MNRPEFTIIYTVNNLGHSLEPTLEGVIEALRASGFEKFDIMVIDYASTDNTPMLMPKIIEKFYPHVKARRIQDSCTSRAFVLGTLSANTPVVIYDSLRNPKVAFYRDSVNTLEEKGADIVFSKTLEPTKFVTKSVQKIYGVWFKHILGSSVHPTRGPVCIRREAILPWVREISAENELAADELSILAQLDGLKIEIVPVDKEPPDIPVSKRLRQLPRNLFDMADIWWKMKVSGR